MITTLAPPNWDLGHQQPLIGMVPNPLHPSREGLLAEWNFNDGTGLKLTDSGGQDYHGTITNGPTWVGSPYGGVVGFDGTDDYVYVGTDPALSCVGGLTIISWAKVVAADSYFAAKMEDTNNKASYAFSASSVGPGLDFHLSADGTTLTTMSCGGLITDVWEQYACTWDGATMRLFIGAQEVGTPTAFAGPIYSGTGRLLLGARQDGAVQKWLFDGQIGYVSIHARALTASEIQRHYADSRAAYQPEPRVYPVAAPSGNPWYAYAQQSA